MKNFRRYLLGTAITAGLALGAVDIKAEKEDNKSREEKVWPGALACNEGLQWGLLCNMVPRLEETEDDIISLYATQGSQGDEIDDLGDILRGTPTLPKPSDTPQPDNTPTPPMHHTPQPTSSATPTRPYETPRPSPPPTSSAYPTSTASSTSTPPRATDIPTQRATPTPDTLPRLIEYAKNNLPRSVDLPPEENVQDRPEGVYIRLFKVWEESGRFRHEEISDLVESDQTSLENHRIGAPTRPYWTVATAGEDFVSEIDGYAQNSNWINPPSLRWTLILNPESQQEIGINSIQFSGKNKDGNNIVYAEVIRTLVE